MNNVTEIRTNTVTVYNDESGEVFGNYRTLSEAYEAVLNNDAGADIPNTTGMAFRIHENGTIIARLSDGALRIETGMGGGRSFEWVESLGVKIGSDDSIRNLSMKKLGLTRE